MPWQWLPMYVCYCSPNQTLADARPYQAFVVAQSAIDMYCKSNEKKDPPKKDQETDLKKKKKKKVLPIGSGLHIEAVEPDELARFFNVSTDPIHTMPNLLIDVSTHRS